MKKLIKRVKRALKIYKPSQEELERKNALDYVLTDKFGNDWYMLRNITDISILRQQGVQHAFKHTDLSITKPKLLDMLASMKTDMNSGNFTNVFKKVTIIEDRLNRMVELETLKLLCYQLTFVNDEPLKELKPYYLDLKTKVFDNDPEVMDFFLDAVWQQTEAYKNSFQLDLADYLMQAKMIQPMLQKALNVNMES